MNVAYVWMKKCFMSLGEYESVMHNWLPNQPYYGWWMISTLHEPHLPLSSIIKNTMNIKPTWICSHNHLSCAIWRPLECVNMLEGEVVMFFGVLWSSCKGVQPCQLQTLLEHRWRSILVEVILFIIIIIILMLIWTCPLWSLELYNSILDTFWILRNSCNCVAITLGQCTYHD